MSVESLKVILDLEKEILQKTKEMSAEEALKFYNQLISCQQDFVDTQSEYWADQSGYLNEYEEYQKQLSAVEYVDRKIIRMQEQLRRVFDPIDKSASSTESKVNNNLSDQNSESETDPTVAGGLNSLLQKQKFYVQMIDSLKPEGELSSKKAELQYEQVTQIYVWFMSNQSKIMTFLKNDDFEDQVNVSREIQRKVLSIQETLKEIALPNKPTALPESKVNDNRIERPNVIVDLLDSLRKKQKFFFEKIKAIDSKNNIDAVEAEILYNHLSQLYESFVKNQAKIDTYVDGVTLDKELVISGEILEKVMYLQMKLKKIFAPVVSPSSDVSMLVDDSEKNSKFDKITVLNSLLDKQQSLIKEIDSMDLCRGNRVSENGLPVLNAEMKIQCGSWLEKLPELENSFISNQRKIEELLNDDYERAAQEEISEVNLAKVAEIQKRLEVVLQFCEMFGM